MANHLNEGVRIEAQALIRVYVEENYGKSKLGLEAAEARAKAAQVLADRIRSLYDQDDMKVLDKYKRTCTKKAVDYHIAEYNGTKKVSTWGAKNMSIPLGEALLAPANISNENILDGIKAGTPEFEALELAWVLTDATKCEVNKLIAGYVSALRSSRTREKVVADYPFMEKFLPYKFFNDGGKPAPATDREVMEFEKELTEEKVNG